jgi:hypothetical protein
LNEYYSSLKRNDNLILWIRRFGLVNNVLRNIVELNRPGPQRSQASVVVQTGFLGNGLRRQEPFNMRMGDFGQGKILLQVISEFPDSFLKNSQSLSLKK